MTKLISSHWKNDRYDAFRGNGMVLKVGVVGVPPFSNSIGMIHSRCYVKDQLSKLVAICDIVKKNAENAARQLGVKAYYDVEEMIL
jgi:predicted dehydrogenase